ncbi:serine/threonine-protein kinase PknD [Microbulbifer sp. NBRC 101763]|uniref:serine/threonine-protein kinase n=1 Tax=Microbulbifer sp. NBRC 101763 TaxID=1113820 RepID=UPI00309B19FD
MISIGETIGGRYEVVAHVGRGGMQEVYRAYDKLLGINVALKTPQTVQSAKRFKASAQVAAKVNHYNIAKTLDYFVEGNAEYLIEEFIDGETLDQKQQKLGILDPHLGARVLHHLAKGVAASHRVNVVHRDLKPSNVMTAKGVNVHRLKITDFGIATLTKEVFDDAAEQGDITLSNSGTIKGALPFMAPEMMFRQPGESPGKSVDIWSIGAMMFKLLTGEYPFGVYLTAAVNVQAKKREPWPEFMTGNTQLAPLARELQSVIDKCLEYAPENRPDANDIVGMCEELCYLAVERHTGSVSNLIQNNYSGFISGGETTFFSMESVYGTRRPNLDNNRRVCYSSFPGSPRPRAHPVIVIDE